MARQEVVSVQLIGGPTAVLEYGELRFLTDPTFDPPSRYELRPGMTMTKHAGPALSADAVPPIDAVLLSHDHHIDNLDNSGREYLTRVPLTLTTRAGAGRLGGTARPLSPWESYELRRPNGGAVMVTAVPAQHGPDSTDHITGEVTGFYLSARGLPTTYVSGDNASVDVVKGIVTRLGSARVAVLHTGAAQMPYLGKNPLTLSAARAPKVARILGAQHVIPVHFDGWAHFSESAAELRDTFAQAGLADRLLVPEPGETITVPAADSLRIAVIGASGGVGRAIVREALAAATR